MKSTLTTVEVSTFLISASPHAGADCATDAKPVSELSNTSYQDEQDVFLGSDSDLSDESKFDFTDLAVLAGSYSTEKMPLELSGSFTSTFTESSSGSYSSDSSSSSMA